MVIPALHKRTLVLYFQTMRIAHVCPFIHSQNPQDAQVVAKGLAGRSLVFLKQDGYRVHDLILDFAKLQILTKPPLVKYATSRQARYLGRLAVVRGYAGTGEYQEGFHALAALWRSVEGLSGDEELEVKTYNDSLLPLERSEATVDVAQVFSTVGGLYILQVRPGRGDHYCLFILVGMCGSLATD